MLLIFVTGGKWMETLAKGRTTDAVNALASNIQQGEKVRGAKDEGVVRGAKRDEALRISRRGAAKQRPTATRFALRCRFLVASTILTS